MKYKVREVWTPEDVECNRRRRDAEFESDSTDINELALLARIACYPNEVTEKTKENIVKAMECDDVEDQLRDYALEDGYFEYKLFGGSGEWDIAVEAES